MPDMPTPPPPATAPVVNAPAGGYAQGVSNPPADPILTNDTGADSATPTATPTQTASATTPPSSNTPQNPAPPAAAASGTNPSSTPAAPPTQPKTPASPSPQQTPSEYAATAAASSDPVQAHAGKFYQFAEALAGGPRYKTTIDANTGVTTRQQVPLSKGDIGMAIALNAISGAFAGLSVKPGPGNLGRAAGAGFGQGEDQTQQAQRQQDQQATADFANHAHATELNSRLILNTAQAERYGVDALKDAVSSNSAVLKGYQDAGEIDETNISQDALMAGMKSGQYNPTQQIAIPDGLTSINGKYEQTFAIVKNPSAKQPITQEQWDTFAANNVPGFTKGTKIPANGAMVPGRMIASATQQVQANQLMQQDASKVTDALSKSSDPANQELAESVPDFKKLLSDPQTGPTLQNALNKFQRYVSHSDVHGMDFYQSLQQMAQPSMQNPQNPKQFIPNPNAGLATTIAGAFGNGDPQKGWDILKAYHDETAPLPKATNPAELQEIANSPNSSARDRKWALDTIHSMDQDKVATAVATKKGEAPFEKQPDEGGPSDADDIADGVVSGKLPPTMDRLYRLAGPTEAAIGRRGYNLAQAQTDYKMVQKRLTTLNSTQQVRLQQSTTNAYEMLPLLQQKYDAWAAAAHTSGYKVLNKATLETMKNLPGNAGAAAHMLDAQISDMTADLGTMYMGGNSPTDHGLELAAKNFNSAWNDTTFKSAIEQARQNIQIRKNSISSSATPVGVSNNSPYLPKPGVTTTMDSGNAGAQAAPKQGVAVPPKSRNVLVNGKVTGYQTPDGVYHAY